MSQGVARAPKATYEKLSPGPGRAVEEVRAHQRIRFHNAMVELVAEHGYANVAVHDLVAKAKVSSRAFYEQFSGKNDCLLRTQALIVRRTARRVVAAQAGERDWHERLRLAFRAFTRELEREPEAMRLALVDSCLNGPAPRAQLRKGELLFASMLAESFGRAPDGVVVSPLAVEAIVAGIAEVARRQILTGEHRPSDRLGDELLEWTLTCRERAAGPLATPLPIPADGAAAARPRSGSSDRDLCLAAVERLVMSQGLTQLTIPRIRTTAGISLPRFKAEFSSAEDCVAAARSERLDPVLARVDHIRGMTAGNAGTAAAVQALCGEFSADPILASLCFEVECAQQPKSVQGTEPEPATVDRVAASIYGASAAKRPSIAVRAGAGMIWTTIEAHAPSGPPTPLQTDAPLLAAMA